MTRIFVLLLVLLSGNAFSATCYKQASFYGCLNSMGATCSKTQVTALIPDTSTDIFSCDYLTISGSDYSAISNSINGSSPLASRVTAAETNITLVNSRVTGLESQVTQWDSAIAQNTQAVGSLNQILNEPFDLETGMAAFAFFFSTTIFLYAVARGAGAILETIRRPLGRG